MATMPGAAGSVMKTPPTSRKKASGPSQTIEECAEALPEKTVLTPNLPIGVFLQEAYNIYRFMQDDRERFTAGNFDWNIVEELLKLIGFLRDAEAALWTMKYGAPIEKQYRDQHEAAVNAYDRLLKDLTFACRKDSDVMRHIKRNIIIKDNDPASFHQGLANLARFAEGYSESLRRVGSDLRLINDVNRYSGSLPKLFVRFNYRNVAIEEQLNLRNRVYTLLKNTIGEIRDVARYVLADDPRRLRGYASEYFRKSSRAGKGMEKC